MRTFKQYYILENRLLEYEAYEQGKSDGSDDRLPIPDRYGYEDENLVNAYMKGYYETSPEEPDEEELEAWNAEENKREKGWIDPDFFDDDEDEINAAVEDDPEEELERLAKKNADKSIDATDEKFMILGVRQFLQDPTNIERKKNIVKLDSMDLLRAIAGLDKKERDELVSNFSSYISALINLYDRKDPRVKINPLDIALIKKIKGIETAWNELQKHQMNISLSSDFEFPKDLERNE